MIKESMDSLETKLGKRKQFLFDDNLEKLQEEFLKKKEKCNSKIIKKKLQEISNDVQDNKNNNTFLPTGEIKKKKGKKKVKDIITLNLPLLSQNDNNNNTKQQSLFLLNFDENKNKEKKNNININTGLPETFKITNTDFNQIKENNDDIEQKVENGNNKDNSNNDEIENNEDEFNSKEYDEISKENEKKIEQMTQEEILEAQKEIFASIPSDLIEKFKDNFFTQKIKKSLNKKEMEDNLLNLNNKDNALDEEKNNNIQENNSKNKLIDNINLKSLNKNENINEEKDEIVLFSYEGKIKKEKKNKYELENPEIRQMIDYRYLTFDQLDLKNKYFSLEEINTLLCSSNNLQISISLKIIYNLLKNNYHKTLDIFIEQLDSILNKLYYLINSSNINVKAESLKCISLVYHDFFYEDYKQFKFNALLLGSYPSVIIFNFANLNKNLQKQKKLVIKTILENDHDTILEYIKLLNNSLNEEINIDILSLIFYTIYVSEKIPCQISKLFEINFDILSKNQALIKLMLLLCNYEDLEQNLEN